MTGVTPYRHADGRHPNIIEPDEDDPVVHRCPLRSQLQANSIVQTVRDVFQNIEECNSVIDKTTENVQEYRYLMRTPAKKVWETSLANNLGRLAQGVGTRMKKGNNNIRFVARQAVPKDRKVTYARLVAELRPHTKVVHRVRVTVGGGQVGLLGSHSNANGEYHDDEVLDK